MVFSRLSIPTFLDPDEGVNGFPLMSSRSSEGSSCSSFPPYGRTGEVLMGLLMFPRSNWKTYPEGPFRHRSVVSVR